MLVSNWEWLEGTPDKAKRRKHEEMTSSDLVVRRRPLGSFAPSTVQVVRLPPRLSQTWNNTRPSFRATSVRLCCPKMKQYMASCPSNVGTTSSSAASRNSSTSLTTKSRCFPSDVRTALDITYSQLEECILVPLVKGLRLDENRKG